MLTSRLLKIAARILSKVAYSDIIASNPIVNLEDVEVLDEEVSYLGGSGYLSDKSLIEYNGKVYFAKNYGGRPDPLGQAYWEWVTGVLLKAAGYRVPDLLLVLDKNQAYIASEYLKGASPVDLEKKAEDIRKDMEQGLYPLLAAFAHWDWLGMSEDNIIELDGEHYYIDTSAGKFRAMGDLKGGAFQGTSESLWESLESLMHYDQSGVLKDTQGKPLIKIQDSIDEIRPHIKGLIELIGDIQEYSIQNGIQPSIAQELEIYQKRLEALIA